MQRTLCGMAKLIRMCRIPWLTAGPAGVEVWELREDPGVPGCQGRTMGKPSPVTSKEIQEATWTHSRLTARRAPAVSPGKSIYAGRRWPAASPGTEMLARRPGPPRCRTISRCLFVAGSRQADCPMAAVHGGWSHGGAGRPGNDTPAACCEWRLTATESTGPSPSTPLCVGPATAG